MLRQTAVQIVDDAFHINGRPTYAGRMWEGHRIEGLLLNARLVQGIFDDLNPHTRHLWAYPDGTDFDAERNTDAFIEQMPAWRAAGLLAFDLNLQGGSPQGYSAEQPWHNSAFDADGSLRDDYFGRLKRILDRADELGMAVMLGYFYFGQDQRFDDEDAIRRAAENATAWVLDHEYTNVLIEIANESDNSKYDYELLRMPRVLELIEAVQRQSEGHVATPSGRLAVSVSLCGNKLPTDEMIGLCDYILLHGNGVKDIRRIGEMVRHCRHAESYRPKPIVFNEDDHFDFDQPQNHFIAAVAAYASWGYFDYRMADEDFAEGYQSVPVDWGTNSERKRGFFKLLREITGC